MLLRKTGEVVASRRKQSPWRLVMLSLPVLTKICGLSRSKRLFVKKLSAFGRARDAPW